MRLDQLGQLDHQEPMGQLALPVLKDQWVQRENQGKMDLQEFLDHRVPQVQPVHQVESSHTLPNLWVKTTCWW